MKKLLLSHTKTFNEKTSGPIIEGEYNDLTNTHKKKLT